MPEDVRYHLNVIESCLHEGVARRIGEAKNWLTLSRGRSVYTCIKKFFFSFNDSPLISHRCCHPLFHIPTHMRPTVSSRVIVSHRIHCPIINNYRKSIDRHRSVTRDKYYSTACTLLLWLFLNYYTDFLYSVIISAIITAIIPTIFILSCTSSQQI